MAVTGKTDRKRWLVALMHSGGIGDGGDGSAISEVTLATATMVGALPVVG